MTNDVGILTDRDFYRLRDEFLNANNSGLLLDIGSGPGDAIGKMENFESAIGIEPWKKSAQNAKSKYPKANFIIGRGENLPFRKDTFLKVNLRFVLEHIKEQQKLFDEIDRVLCPGGTLIIVSPNADSLHGVIVRLVPVFFRDTLLKSFQSDATGTYSEEEKLFYKYCSIRVLDNALDKKGYSRMYLGRFIGKAPFDYENNSSFSIKLIQTYWRSLKAIVKKKHFQWMAPTFLVIYKKKGKPENCI